MALNQLPDFSYKGGVPNELVSAYQNKVAQEEQMRMNQEALKQQKIKNVQDTFTAGAGLVDNLMQFNKQKQMKDAQDALIALFRKGSDEVTATTGQMTPAKSSHLPQLNQAAVTENKPYSATPEYKQELQALITQFDPKQAGDEIAKYAFAQLKGTTASPKGTYQQSTIQIPGKDGRNKTVSVVFDTASGQYLNPQTMQPLVTDEDYNNLPERGYAQSARNAGYTIDGREVVADARSGKKMVYGEDGQLEEYTGKIYPKLENIPAGLADSLSELNYSQEVLGRIETNFDPAFVGPIAARAGKMSQYLEALTEEQRVEFYGNVAEYKNSIIKAITGAQMSEVEAARIIQQIPNENASPKAFMAGLKRAKMATEQRIKAKERGLAAGGYVARPADPEKIQKQMDGKLPSKAADPEADALAKALGLKKRK